MTSVTENALPVARSTRSRVAQPALLFIVLSLIFGGLIVALNPPFRAPDEPAHFLRVYGLSRGELIPALEVDGRKGLYIPADLHDQFDLFFRAVEQGLKNTSWPRVYEQYRLMQPRPEAEKRPDVFIPYQGSEGYTPAAYLAHVPAALVARLFNLDFLTTIMLIRAAGLVFMTAIAAYAILITPQLKWAFFLIAMLPSALYGRSIIGADGGSLSYAMIVTALCLRAMYDRDADRTGARAFWMLLCALAKPPQLAMILLEPMVRRGRDWPRAWKSFAIVMLPSLILSPLWIYLVSADAAVWRVTAGGWAPEQFTIRWKAAFMLDDPWHFPAAMVTTVTEHWYGLWREFFGKLGWLDSPLNDWIYVFLNVALIGVMLEKLDLDWRVRLRIAFWSVATFVGYAIAVFLILFIMWTPVPTTQVGGVQGRYFIVILPALALFISALLPAGLNQRTLAAIAIIGSLVAAFATVEILWRTHWA